MPRKKDGRKVISVILTDKEYEQIKLLAAKKHVSMAEIECQFTLQGLNGTLTQDNIEYIVPIIREQLTSILNPMMERMIGLEAKSCIQSGTAAYLCAEAILKFVPPAQRAEVHESYDAARKKAVAAMQGKLT